MSLTINGANINQITYGNHDISRIYQGKNSDNTPRLIWEKLIRYNVVASVNPTNSGIVSGGGTYKKGSIATLTATPYNGYFLVNWNDLDAKTNPRNILVDGNKTIVANMIARQQSRTVSNEIKCGTIRNTSTTAEGAEWSLYIRGTKFVSGSVTLTVTKDRPTSGAEKVSIQYAPSSGIGEKPFLSEITTVTTEMYNYGSTYTFPITSFYFWLTSPNAFNVSSGFCDRISITANYVVAPL